jgi:hypothetical protein
VDEYDSRQREIKEEVMDTETEHRRETCAHGELVPDRDERDTRQLESPHVTIGRYGNRTPASSLTRPSISQRETGDLTEMAR